MGAYLALNECLPYVQNIMNLELECYEQKRMVENLWAQYTSAQGAAAQALPEAPKDASTNGKGLLIDLVFWVCVPTVLGFLIGGFFGLRANFTKIGLVVGLVMCLLGMLGNRSDKKEYQKEAAQYRRDLEQVQARKQAEEQKAAYFQNMLRESQDRLKETENVLAQYYDLGYIYPKYRGLVPISTIFEYLESGRCFTLEGPDGAYNLYEQELRMNLILGKLDDIIYRLDEISANQQSLAQAVQQGNAKIDRLCGIVQRLEENTEVIQYYSGVTAANTNYLAWLESFRCVHS